LNGLTQGKIAVIVASTLLSLQWGIMLFIYYGIATFHIYLFLIPILSALITYFLVLILIEYFILRKIKILYRTVSTLGKKVNRNSLQDPELFEKLREQVQQFSEEKSSEIQALKENEKFRREFIGNVSHELKTPLTSIQGFIDILIEEVRNGGTADLKYLEKIAKNSDRLIDIVQDLTIISQAENRQMILKKEKFRIYELCLEVIDALDEMAKEKKIKFEFKDTSYIAYTVYADRQKIYQVLYNLLENAIFYNPVFTKIDIRFFDMDNSIMIEVSDNGMGIEKEHLPRIFERFYRIDENRSREKGGSGLGLSIVKNILEAHGQSIQVESKIGKGTRFRFTLEK